MLGNSIIHLNIWRKIFVSVPAYIFLRNDRILVLNNGLLKNITFCFFNIGIFVGHPNMLGNDTVLKCMLTERVLLWCCWNASTAQTSHLVWKTSPRFPFPHYLSCYPTEIYHQKVSKRSNDIQYTYLGLVYIPLGVNLALLKYKSIHINYIPSTCIITIINDWISNMDPLLVWVFLPWFLKEVVCDVVALLYLVG